MAADLEDVTSLIKKAVGQLGNISTALASGGQALAKGSVTAETLATLGTELSGLIPVVGNFSGALGKAAEAGIGLARDLQAGTQYGVYFQENVAEFGKTVLQARDSMESWQARLEKSATAFNTLGLGMDNAMKQFGSMAKQLQDTPLAMQLEATGIKAEELNDVLALSISARKFADFSQERTSQIAINSALTLSKEMDELARFTGMSRKQQQDQLEAELKKPDVAAMMLAMTEEQAAAFLETSAKLGAQAENVRDLFAEYATGGIRTEQGAATAAALEYIDPRINKMMEESAKLSQSGNEDDRKRAAELSSRVSELISGSLSPEKLKQIAILARTGDPVAEALNKVITETKSLGAERSAQMEVFRRQQKGEFDLTVEDVKREMATKVKAEREAEPTEETGVYKGVTGLDRFGKDVAALASTEFPKLNEAVGGVTKELFGMQGALRARTVAELETSKEAVFADIQGYITKLKETPADTLKEIPGQMYESAKDGIQSGLEAVGVPGTWIKNGSDAVNKVEDAVDSIRAKLQSRETGSIGAAGGKLIEDWGKESLVKLHGKEGVITEEQLSKMYQSTQSAIGSMNKGNMVVQAPPDRSTNEPSIDSLIDKIRGPFSSLESRLKTLSEKDINRLVADDTGSAELKTQIKHMYSGKPMFLDPIVRQVKSKIDSMSASKDNAVRDELKQIASMQGKPLFSSSVSTVKLADESTKNLKESISKSSDEYKNLTSEVVSHSSKTQASIAEHAKTVNKVTAGSVKPLESLKPAASVKPLESPKPIEQYKLSAELTRAFSTKPGEGVKSSPINIGDIFRNIGDSIVKQVNSIGNVILGVPSTINDTLKTSQVQLQNAVSNVGTSFEKASSQITGSVTNKVSATTSSYEDNLKKTIAGLGVTPMFKSPTPITGSYNPYTAKTQELGNEEKLTKTLSNLGITTFGAAPKPVVLDMSDPFTKMAKEQAAMWEKMGAKVTMQTSPVIKPAVESNDRFTKFALEQERLFKNIVPNATVEKTYAKPKVDEPQTDEFKNVKALISKAKEKIEAGDTATAKIYEDSARRQLEKIKESTRLQKQESISKLGPGADMAAINAKRSAQVVSPITMQPKSAIRIDESKIKEPAKKVKEAEQSVVTTAAKEKSEMPKTKDLEKIVAAPKPISIKEPEKPKPVAPVDQTTMSDLKSELVELNKHMRILIAHTDEVADNSKKQVRATQQSSTNNILG